MNRRHQHKRRKRTTPKLPLEKFTDDTREFDYSATLAELNFDPADADRLESRSQLKPAKRGLQLRPVAAQPFASLGARMNGDE